MSILLFLLVLFVLILVHEWGHFIVAKKTGMRVDEFGIGFPPKLFGWKKGETEYTFNLFPVGGFVRIYGENAVDAASDATEGATVSGSFTEKSKWAQTAVLIAGVTMNIILAWVLFVAAFMVGVPSAVDETVVPPGAADLVVQGVLPEGPAAAAGLPPAAVITAVASGETSVDALTPTIFSEFIIANVGQEVLVTYEDNGATGNVTIVPQTDIIPQEPATPAIGVSLAYVDEVQYGFFEAVANASVQTVTLLQAIVLGLTDLIVTSFTGTADYSQIAGPVGIVGMVGDAAAIGVVALLMFTAVISLNLAVINLLPFPALDGGRLLFVAIEAIIRRPIDPVWVARLNGVGFLLLLLLMVAVTYNDIAKLL